MKKATRNSEKKKREFPWEEICMASVFFWVGARFTYKGLMSHGMIAGSHRSGPTTPYQALLIGLLLLAGSIYVGYHVYMRIKQNRK
jgi:hypothetical protein